MKLNEEILVDIIDVDNKANGIAKVDNFVIFVKNGLIDEKTFITIKKLKKQYAYAQIKKLKTISTNRVEPICKYYHNCGGCSFLHTTFINENKIKENYIKHLFKDYKVNDLLSGNEYFYRNKAIFHIKNGQIGYYEENSNNLIPINTCYLLDKDISNIINIIKKFNLLKTTEIMLRKSLSKQEVMIVINGFISDEDVSLLKTISCIKSIYINDKHIYGNTYITETIDRYCFSIYPKSFFQVNHEMTKVLYDTVKKYAGNGDKLLDLYCGTGTIGIYLHENFKKIIGIEIVEDAIKNALINKELNNIDNIDFICGDAKDLKEKDFDVVVVDPPRKGLTQSLIDKLQKINPKKIVYVSCNPNTLKRDISLLNNYELINLTPINMFPKTQHCEVVCLLKSKK